MGERETGLETKHQGPPLRSQQVKKSPAEETDEGVASEDMVMPGGDHVLEAK